MATGVTELTIEQELNITVSASTNPNTTTIAQYITEAEEAVEGMRYRNCDQTRKDLLITHFVVNKVKRHHFWYKGGGASGGGGDQQQQYEDRVYHIPLWLVKILEDNLIMNSAGNCVASHNAHKST